MRQPPAEAGAARPRRGPIRWLARVMLAGLVLFLGWLWFVWPPPAWYRWAWPRETAFMAMRRHQEEHLPASTGRTRPPVRLYQPVPLALMPPAMRTAALIGEDHRFYEHGGIDYEAIRDAMGYRRPDFRWASAGDRSELRRAVGSLWGRRSRIRGASTITQQLAKNLYLSPSRNPLRKLKEAVTAWRLEYWLGKNRILELYLNVVELGREVWGVEAASRKYFGHSASRLTLEEAGALAATLPFPLVSNPGFRPARMRWRQSMIVRRVRGEDVTVPRDTGEFADLVPDTVRVAPMDTLRDSLRIEPADTTKNTTRSRPRDTLEWGSQGGGGR